jgi:type II secretory pathway component PulK
VIALSSHRKERGSSLIATFWLIATLGMIVFGATKFISVDGSLLAARKSMAFARAHAETGLALGAHPDTRAGDDLLFREYDDGGSYSVNLSTEEALLNVNELLKRNQSAVLKRLFHNWGIAEQNAAAIADAIKDWVDADDLASLNGAERGAYPNVSMPYNRPFRSLDELALVRGMDHLARVRPTWREAFSQWSEGRVDLNHASADVIAATVGVEPLSAEIFIAVRAGTDGIAGTQDDRRFTTVPEALAAMQVPRERMASLDSMLTVSGKTRRVESLGTFGEQRRKLVLIRRGATTLWRGELPIRELPDNARNSIQRGAS